MPDTRPLRDELQATLDARRDLGPDYEPALIDSFVDRIDATITARVRAELDHHGAAPRRKPPASQLIPLALGSMGLGIPLTAIGAAQAGGVGLLIVWLAIVVINVAAAVAIIRRP
ncbi:hypothetical protein ACIBP6_13395 [Nonomuraea terrae]|uniref:hypothetical protein n=1 Tax=Nonomuraea terrae TaxID=2530383 RepID=UPI00379C05EB